jgi:predicted metal-binding membrane protein
MMDTALEALLRRDRLVVAGALGVVTALAWSYVLWLAADMEMGGMDMTGFRMIPAGMGIMAPANAPWKPIEFAFVFAMWAVMMVGMMAPSAAPMILMYARVGQQGPAEGKPLAASGWFAAGYFLAWIAFSLAATLAQWSIERAALLDAQMASASDVLGGVVLIAAGAYQWTPLKDVCLRQCQSPLGFLITPSDPPVHVHRFALPEQHFRPFCRGFRVEATRTACASGQQIRSWGPVALSPRRLLTL